jgi:hypothetical protein
MICPSFVPRLARSAEDAGTAGRRLIPAVHRAHELVRQCETMGEFAIAEHVRQILLDEQDHLIGLASALGEDVPDLSKPRS